jgi:hypothetical protein
MKIAGGWFRKVFAGSLAILIGGTAVCFAQSGPAAAPAGGQPADTGPALQSFGAFSILGSTATGKTLYLKLPAGLALEAAITQAADELGKVLDAKPVISDAFAKAADKSEGGAGIAGKLKGKDIKGLMFVGTGTAGASATIIIDAADAPKEDAATLMGFIPTAVKMTTHTFPDGSGSIDLPDGWTTPMQSASGGIVVIGPGKQTVWYCNIRQIYDPQCGEEKLRASNYQLAMRNYQTRLRMYNQSVTMKKQFPNTIGPGDPPAPPAAFEADGNLYAIKNNLPMRYCKYCDGPEEVLKVYYPLQAELGKKTGLPYTALDKTIAVIPAPVDPAYPNFKSGTVYIAVTDHDGDKESHFRALNFFSTSNSVPGEVWQLTMCSMRAPDDTFDKDLPVMSAIENSVKINMKVVGKEISDAGQATRAMGQQMFDTMEKNHAAWQDQQARQFADHEEQMAAQQKAVHDSTSDFIEYVGGARDVFDNQTGKTDGKVDLFNSNAIVGAMNAAANDPGRFVQIPLRYER